MEYELIELEHSWDMNMFFLNAGAFGGIWIGYEWNIYGREWSISGIASNGTLIRHK
jgi:hypothetical protein